MLGQFDHGYLALHIRVHVQLQLVAVKKSGVHRMEPAYVKEILEPYSNICKRNGR